MDLYRLPDDPGVTDVAPTSVSCATCGARVEALNEVLARFYLDRHLERVHGAAPRLAPPLVRSTNGATIHRETCRRPGARTPWRWANGRTLAEVRGIAHDLDLRACAFCRPLDDDETRDEEEPR